MAGPGVAARCAARRWLGLGLIALMAGCATPPHPAADLPTASPPAAGVQAPSMAPHPSRLSDFISRRLRKPASPAVPLAEPAKPAAEPSADDKYQLTGEAARELERGHASWYGSQFHGRRTASGENYDKYALTAAHKTLPFGTIVRVRSLALGREVDVRINDRGPFSPGRVIDVSQAAAEALGLVGSGGGEVSLKVADGVAETAKPSDSPRKTSHRTARKHRNPARQ